MKCIQCGGAVKTKKENYRHPALGLSNVTLVGVEVSRCPKCGDVEVAIPRIEGLYRMLTQVVATKPERLNPEEIRFLRKQLGWSGADFAEHFDVTPQSVSRWENGKQDMGAVAERLLRLCALSREPVKDHSVLRDMAKSEQTTKPIRFSMKDKWKLVA